MKQSISFVLTSRSINSFDLQWMIAQNLGIVEASRTFSCIDFRFLGDETKEWVAQICTYEKWSLFGAPKCHGYRSINLFSLIWWRVEWTMYDPFISTFIMSLQTILWSPKRIKMTSAQKSILAFSYFVCRKVKNHNDHQSISAWYYDDLSEIVQMKQMNTIKRTKFQNNSAFFSDV